MSKTESAVLDAIRLDAFITAKQIVGQIQKTEKTVYRAIKILKKFKIYFKTRQ